MGYGRVDTFVTLTSLQYHWTGKAGKSWVERIGVMGWGVLGAGLGAGLGSVGCRVWLIALSLTPQGRVGCKGGGGEKGGLELFGLVL